jgi:Chromate resistance exported protein
LFRAARDADYAAISEEAKELGRKFPVGKGLKEEHARELEAGAARLRRRLAEVVGIDFFDCLGRQSAEGLVASLEARLNPDASGDDRAAPSSGEYRGRVWVTRKGIHVDRMASAWLIRRFIDPEAKFKFVPAREYQPQKLEIRFDMFEADFTHEGDRCTFEVLLQRLKLNHPALRPIAEIVHDIDLKDGNSAGPKLRESSG